MGYAAPEGAERCWEFDAVRLHVVSGKGGTGKTTVAAALAVALAAGGRRTLLVEVEGRQSIAQLFDCPPLPYSERRIAAAPGGGVVYGLSVDAQAALLEYLDLHYHLGRAGRGLERLGAIDFATTIAPGLRDVLLTGKAYEAVRRRQGDRFVYDAVVLDAPPTGRIGRFLDVNTQVADLARVGPIRNQAESIMRVIRSPRTAVHLVTLLEEMPVQEALDGLAELRNLDLPLGAFIVNRAREPYLWDADVDVKALRSGLRAAGIEDVDAVLPGLVAEATAHARRVQRERELLDRLGDEKRPVITLPELGEQVDVSSVHHLAHLLSEQGVA